MTDFRKQYMRDQKRNKVGVMVAIKTENFIRFGFSKCNTSKDKFDKQIGTDIAIGRAIKYSRITSAAELKKSIPDSVYKECVNFVQTTVDNNPTCRFPAWVFDLN
jgi:hypothetical protein